MTSARRPPSATERPTGTTTPTDHAPDARAHRRGFWLVVAAFLALMAFATLPTPLYPAYQRLDGFPTFVITLIFAAYGFGVMAGLYLVGHLSDQLGRRRVLLAATVVEIVSAVMFLLLHDTASLLVARFVCGAGIGAVTATATAALAELHAKGRPDADPGFASVVAGTVNTGGLALGSLAAGLLTEWLPDPLELPYGVWVVLLVLAFLGLLAVPETVHRDGPRPPYHPQKVSVAPDARPRFAAAAVAAVAAFCVLGLFTSLTASFVGGTLGVTSRLVTGAIVFGVIGASALSQAVLGRAAVGTRLAFGTALMSVGLVLVGVGALATNLPTFVVAGLLSGAGLGLLFNVALATAAAVAEPDHAGETLAGMFLAAYAGITVPVILTGVAVTVFAPQDVLVVFAAVVLVAVLAATARMRSHLR